jgi:hypothetical protein
MMDVIEFDADRAIGRGVELFRSGAGTGKWGVGRCAAFAVVS